MRYKDVSLTPPERARDLLDRLTLREKVGQVNQRLYGFRCYERQGDDFSLTEECISEIRYWGGLGTLYGLYRADPWSGKDESNGIPPRLAAKAYNLLQREVIKSSRFGIPALMSSECPHGHQALGGYLLPVGLAMGASFNPKLVEDAFAVCGEQLKELGVDLALVSVLDVLRDPRWGRSEECFGEDPVLCSMMAAAVVRGLSGAGVDTVAKHLCAQGETTGGLNASAARIGWRELREIHLPPAIAACNAGTKGFMAAYNEIDGVPCHSNAMLLRGFLRDELGFTGVVMADGTAVDRLDSCTGDNTASGALALASGVDVSLWDSAFSRLESAVETGLVPEKILNQAVLRVLELKFGRGLFESPYLDENKAPRQYKVEAFPQSLELARQSVVLLKNENKLLPLDPKVKLTIALIGPNGDALYNQLGDYSPPLSADEGCTLRQGLALESGGGCGIVWEKGCDILRGCEEGLERAVKAAAKSDVVILALGGSSSRFSHDEFDTNGAALGGSGLTMDCGEGVDKAELSLPECQSALISAICALGKPVIAVVIGGRPYAIPELKHGVNALLFSFYPGPWGGKALAEIIFGAAVPSGRLPVSIPVTSGQIPCSYNSKSSYTAMAYSDIPQGPLYPFGAGLGYTVFRYSKFHLCKKDEGLAVRFAVRNDGDFDGWAVPMLYLSWQTGDTSARIKELRRFGKTWLERGCKREIELLLTPQDLYRWNRELKWEPAHGKLLIMLEESGEEIWRNLITV